MRIDGLPALERILRGALEPRAEVLEAYLFGSWARGEAVGHSDVDVAVYVDPGRVQESTLLRRTVLVRLHVEPQHRIHSSLVALAL